MSRSKLGVGYVADYVEPPVVPFLRSPFNYDRDAVSLETGLCCEDVSKTQQHMRDECDINVIMERFGKTGQLPPPGVRMPEYGDFTAVSDYQSALEAVRAASESFMAMPAALRAEFNNDPAAFVDFFADPANRAEAERLGLVQKPLAAAPTSPPAPAAPAAPAAS